jgi:GMP synthase-like glutamine amidotransferase
MRVLVFKHISCEGPGRLADFAAQNGHDLEVIDLEKGQTIPSLDVYQALVVLGGPMNVYEEDKFPYLRMENTVIQGALQRQLPYLGICLGGQLLAKAAGGRVTKNPRKEIGNFTVQLNADGQRDPLFQEMPSEIPVFQWHGDTFNDIANGVSLASSKICRQQAFRLGSCAYGLQFHVEITLAQCQEWFDEYNVEVKQEMAREGLNPTAIVTEFARLEPQYEELSQKLFRNFFRIAQQRWL